MSQFQKQPPEMLYRKSCFKNFAIFTGERLCWNPFLRKLQALKPANLSKEEYCKNFKNTYFGENLRTTASTVPAPTVNISSWVLVSALNSIGLLQRSSSRLKKFSLGCLVVGSSFIWKKEKLAGMVTRWHSLSLVVPLVVILYHSLSFFFIRCHSLSLVVIRSLYHSLSFVVIRCTTRWHSMSFIATRCHSMYHSSAFL